MVQNLTWLKLCTFAFESSQFHPLISARTMATAPDLRLSQRRCGLAARPVDDDRLLALFESLG